MPFRTGDDSIRLSYAYSFHRNGTIDIRILDLPNNINSNTTRAPIRSPSTAAPSSPSPHQGVLEHNDTDIIWLEPKTTRTATHYRTDPSGLYAGKVYRVQPNVSPPSPGDDQSSDGGVLSDLPVAAVAAGVVVVLTLVGVGGYLAANCARQRQQRWWWWWELGFQGTVEHREGTRWRWENWAKGESEEGESEEGATRVWCHSGLC